MYDLKFPQRKETVWTSFVKDLGSHIAACPGCITCLQTALQDASNRTQLCTCVQLIQLFSACLIADFLEFYHGSTVVLANHCGFVVKQLVLKVTLRLFFKQYLTVLCRQPH